MTEEGDFAAETFEGRVYAGKALFDYCDRRAREGYFAAPGSPQRQAGAGFPVVSVVAGRLSPIFGRSAMTTFERLFIADKSTHTEVKNPYYRHIQSPETADRILREFGLAGEGCHIINGHVPVRAIEGESPVKGGGKGDCHRRRLLPGLPPADRHRGVHAGVQQPRADPAQPISPSRAPRKAIRGGRGYRLPQRVHLHRAPPDSGAGYRTRAPRSGC